MLQRDSIILLLNEDDACINIGMVVNRRDEDLLLERPVVTITFFSRELAFKGLTCVQQNLRLIQLSATLFSSVPVLQYFQKVSQVPMYTDILNFDAESVSAPPGFTDIQSMYEAIHESSPDEDIGYIFGLSTKLLLDPSQKNAISQSLSKSVSLIHVR